MPRSEVTHTKVLTKTFTAKIVREYSSLPKADDLGTHESTMDLYLRTDTTGFIEWDIPAVEETELIGLWFDIGPDGKRTLRDYDGIMSLPREAVLLMREAGIVVPNDHDDGARFTSAEGNRYAYFDLPGDKQVSEWALWANVGDECPLVPGLRRVA